MFVFVVSDIVPLQELIFRHLGLIVVLPARSFYQCGDEGSGVDGAGDVCELSGAVGEGAGSGWEQARELVQKVGARLRFWL